MLFPSFRASSHCSESLFSEKVVVPSFQTVSETLSGSRGICSLKDQFLSLNWLQCNNILMEIKYDCRYLDGYKPCKAHKQKQAVCASCASYSPIVNNILILKTGAAGEVVRNTPLLTRLRQLYPNAKLTWVTHFPDLIPKGMVDEVLKFSWENICYLASQEFDIVYSLDKDKKVCGVLSQLNYKMIYGFKINANGAIIPANDFSKEKWLTGIWDHLMLENTKHYVEETFEVCGWEWRGEEYVLPNFTVPKLEVPQNGKPWVGVNTGAGAAWRTRVLSAQKLEGVVSVLKDKYNVILLGGPEEEALNQDLSAKFQKDTVYSFGVLPLLDFIGLMSKCDLIITSVTMALHLAIGLKKKIVLLNNIFPPNEFYLYGLGEILEPQELSCKYCYKSKFDAKCQRPDCLDSISNDHILKKVDSLLN